MPTINYSGNRVFILLLLLVGMTPLFAQEKHAQSGMIATTNNLTSFPVSESRHLDDWKKYNDPRYYSHPDFGKLPENAPCENCVEVLEKRTVDERYFIDLNDTHQFYLQRALGDLHHQVNGDWVTIDPTLRPVSGTRYESAYLPDQPIIDFAAARTELKMANGTLRFNQWKLIVIQNGTEARKYTADWSDYTVGTDGAMIHHIFPGIDAEMIVQKGAIKTSFIIKSNEFGVFDQLLFREELEAGSPVHAKFTGGTYSRGIGSLKLMAGSTELAVMDEAKLFAKGGPKSLARSGEYIIHSNLVDLAVDYDWINENIGLYELVVDPTVSAAGTLGQASITGSRYNGSCNFTNSCDYNLTFSSPANATITDVNFSFTYSANGTTCWLQDGATRIGLGGCNSPSAAGYYWFCNGIGGGTCTATNQTIFSDISGCVPAPSCTPQSMTFTLKFYRSCWGSTGCSNTCIGAASPFVVNVIGKTLEYTNVTTPITLSATTLCQGGSLTASTSGTGGVPGYTYNWSFSPSGTPSVGSGASASITFPTSGTVTLYSIVTDACGNQVTNSRTVTVTAGTPPTITAGGPTTFCAGGSVVLTSSSATGNTWSNGATTQSITVTAGGSYTVTVTGGGGCSSTSAATVVTVTPLPATPTVTASGPTTFCSGGSVTLTSSSATGNTWSTGATTQSITVSTSGTYTLTVTAGGCTSAATSTTVTVNPLPAAPTITAGGPTTFCSGGSVTLTSSAATGNTWSTGATTQAITVTSSGSYTVTFMDANGCSATSAATVVTVNPTPAVPTITAGGPTTFCSGGSVTLTSSASTGNTWSTGATTQSITVTTSGSYTVTVSSGSCSSISAATTVTVNPLPATPTIAAGGPTTFCAGGSVTLTSSSATGNTWSTGATTQSITVTTSGSYTVTVSNGSCSATSAATAVTVNPLPATPTITAGGPTTFCAGGSVTLTSSSATGNTWSTGATTQSITVTTSGSYTVTVSNGPCSAVSAATTVTVNPLPATPTITAGGPTTFCSGGSVVLTSSSATGNTWSTGATTQSITATTSGSYTVTVSNGSCSATSAATAVTVNPLPATPTITAGGSTTFCAGGSVTLTSSSATGNTWSTGATTQSITVTTSGSYTVTVSNGPCSATSAATAVTVNPLPATPTITAGGPTTFCAGGSVVLTSSSATGNTWSTGATTQSITVTASGSYTVTVSNGSCSSTSAATSVTVNPIPATPTITAGGPTTFCAGSSVVLTSSAASGNTWSGGATTQSITVTASGSYTVTVSSLGCSSTSAPTAVTVNAIPTVTASNNGPLCVNQPLNLTANGTTGGTYSWTGPNSFSSTSQNPTIPAITGADFGVYTVTISLNSCTATATTTVTSNSGVSTAINAAGPFCANDAPVSLVAASPGGNWSGTGIVNTSTGLFDPGVSGPGSFTITYDIPGSCSGPSTRTIVVNAIPATNFIADTLSGCAPLPVTFTNQTSSTTSAQWNFGNGLNATSPLNASTTYTSSGCFTVALTVTDLNGCSATSTKVNFVCITPGADASFTPSPYDATVTHSEIHFINTSTNATSYTWTFGDGGNSAAVSPTHEYDEVASNYTVQLVATNAFGCSDTARVVVRVLDELVYYIPNSFTPNGDEHNNTFQPVFTSGFDPYSFRLLIFNKWGETIFESKDASVGWDGTYNGVLVPEGMYVWTVSFKDPNTDKKYTKSGHMTLIK
ncbi:PKD domain-containing protein [Fluviicola sp.]|uniref:PKD domain-containing protein n=1 Tax=Fluviicola sp. TaxID=1917219 RepID=UPI0031D5FEB4